MTNPLLKVLLQHRRAFAPVVPFNAREDKLAAIDLTSSNATLIPAIYEQTGPFSEWVESQRLQAGARYCIGGYAEHRVIYSRSELFDDGSEPRRLHLGTDLWAEAGTPVCSPLPGTVQSIGVNAASGDYGGTIILRHELDEIIFFTLYGHLLLNVDLEPGAAVNAGQVIALFGDPAVNGNWPPHLHFQLIMDLRGYVGDYPGVCRFSERDSWLRNSPDPDFILQLNQYIH